MTLSRVRPPGVSRQHPSILGFSLLELVVVICIIGTLLAVALYRLLPYAREAERVAVLTLEGQLRNALVMAAAQQIARGQAAQIARLNGSNPMELLLDPPGNYLGELQPADPAQIPGRHWYFDRVFGRLVYQPGRAWAGILAGEPASRLEFEVRVAFDDHNGNAEFEPGIDELYGVRLQRVAGVSWLKTGKMEPISRDGKSV